MALPAAMLMSGLTPECLTNDVQDFYGKGPLLLLKTPSSLDDEVGNPFSKLVTDPRALVRNLTPFFEFLSKANDEQKVQESPKAEVEVQVEVQVEDAPPSPPPPPQLPKLAPAPPKNDNELKIMYQGRDLLDLASNISWKSDFQAAVVPDGVDSFFQNRSQISRIGGAEMPEHVLVDCEYEECSFKVPHFL